MTVVVLLLIGALVGVTTVLFGFGGGFVTVPVVAWADHDLGSASIRVATATSLVVMVVNAVVATSATPRSTLEWLRGRRTLVLLLAVGGVVGVVIAPHLPAEVLRWGFVAYVALTLVDLLVRRGFVQPEQSGRRALPDVQGVPIGAIASLLGVGGSVMTVPALRRAGASMPTATALANPLTVAISLPAAVVALLLDHGSGYGAGIVGPIDLRAAGALLVTAIPVVVLLRRRPLAIPDRVQAVAYLGLLAAAGVAVALR